MADLPPWFKKGFPEPEKATERQLMVLIGKEGMVIDMLTPEERVNVEFIGFEEWLVTLDKWEAGRILDRVLNQNIVNEIRRKSEGKFRRKWWFTGLSDHGGLKKSRHSRDEPDGD